MDYALRILSMRDYSESTMREKLYQRFERKEAEETIEKLKELNYINDLRYAENFASSNLLAGYGIYAVIRKLKEKGVDANGGFIKSVAQARDIDMDALLHNTMKKYLAKTHDEDRISLRTKCFAHMFRRGFELRLVEIEFERLMNESDFS